MLTTYLKRLKAARDHYGFSYPYLVASSIWARLQPPSKRVSHFDTYSTPWDGWYMMLAKRSYDRADYYKCVNGTCIVIWDKKRGNMGGSGPVGCSCDDMDDPRGEKID